MTADEEVLTWNMAFGLVLSYDWDEQQHTLDSPWLDLVGSFQKALGPHYAGQPLAAWEEPGPGLTRSVFGDLSVLANWNDASVTSDGHGIAPRGFFARTADGGVLAGAFTGSFAGAPLSAGTHYLLVERGAAAISVRQPVGDDTDLSLDVPAGWTRVQALAADGSVVGDVDATVGDGRIEFRCAGTLRGTRVDSYRITPSQ
jgi:hypothetical protein